MHFFRISYLLNLHPGLDRGHDPEKETNDRLAAVAVGAGREMTDAVPGQGLTREVAARELDLLAQRAAGKGAPGGRGVAAEMEGPAEGIAGRTLEKDMPE